MSREENEQRIMELLAKAGGQDRYCTDSAETIARYQTFFEDCQEAITILTSEAGVLDANQACLDLLGYAREEIIGSDAARLFWGGSEELRRFHNDIERHGSVKDYDILLRRKDGKQIDCLVAATSWRDKDGLPGCMAILRDATDQKKTEHSLRCLLRMNAELNSASNLDDLLDLLVEQLLELNEAESGCAGLRTPQGMSSRHFSQGPEIVPLTYHCPPGVGWAGRLIEHGLTI